MAKQVKSYRLEPVLIERIAAYAKSRGSTPNQVIEAAAESFLDLAQRGVPDLPKASPVKAVMVKPVPTVVRASSLDAKRRANPAGMDRQANIERQRGA